MPGLCEECNYEFCRYVTLRNKLFFIGGIVSSRPNSQAGRLLLTAMKSWNMEHSIIAKLYIHITKP
jgi:hypothetical protein